MTPMPEHCAVPQRHRRFRPQVAPADYFVQVQRNDVHGPFLEAVDYGAPGSSQDGALTDREERPLARNAVERGMKARRCGDGAIGTIV